MTKDTVQLRSRAKAAECKEPKEVSKSKIISSQPMGFAPMVVLLLFSFAMLVLPLGTYFLIQHYITRSTTICAMGAIVMVQLIVAAYIYKAWNDENWEHEQRLKDKLKKR